MLIFTRGVSTLSLVRVNQEKKIGNLGFLEDYTDLAKVSLQFKLSRIVKEKYGDFNPLFKMIGTTKQMTS